jgi:rhamnosyltransferase
VYKKLDTTCAVVLYNPLSDIFENIKSYIDQVDRIYAIDNSEKSKEQIIRGLKKFKKISYIQNKNNLGIAAALNIAVKIAIKSGYKFMLTMDQDSKAPPNMVKDLFNCVKKYKFDINTLGIISPFHQDIYMQSPPIEEVEEILYVMTSGNLLNLNAFEKVGKFSEELFIDRVDHEYCLRLQINGYKVVRVNKIFLTHNLGKVSKYSIFGRTQYVTNHSPLRRYYITRNTLYVINKYRKYFPDYASMEYNNHFYDICKLLLFEKEKFKKIKMIFKGYLDYKKGITGKLLS